jgi:hypothetical protein
MATFSFEVPEWVIGSTGQTPDTFVPWLRLAAAMFWYGRGAISQGTAAAVAGLDRTTFLLEISKHKQDIFALEPEDLQRELDRIAAEYHRSADG